MAGVTIRTQIVASGTVRGGVQIPITRTQIQSQPIVYSSPTKTGVKGDTGATGAQGPKGDAGDPATNLVASVAGKTGAVTLDKTDVGLSNVDNLAPADMPVSTAQQTALNAKANASDTVNLTGNQTVAGVKTFSSSPIVPTATTTTQAVNKAQMDTADALKVNKAGDTMTGRLDSTLSTGNGFQQARTKTIQWGVNSTGQFNIYNATDLTSMSDFDPAGTGFSIGSWNAGVRYLKGTGFPEGVTSAPVGSIYIDTAVTNGASSWIKKSGTGNTGWQVLEGDTGWREIAGAFIGLTLRVRRINGIVYHRWSGTPNITGNSTTYAYPTGFTGDSYTAWIFCQGGVPTNMRIADDGGSAIFYGLTNTTVNYPTSSLTTSAQWPTSLPGVSV